MTDTDLIKYYSERANEYENIYAKPERQNDLSSASAILQDTFKNKNIFEISCGTGYWTERLAKTAKSILATDISEPVLEIARQKNYSTSEVQFATADFFSYTDTKKYEGLFGGFIWSHIQLQDLKKFIGKINSFVLPGGTIAFIDNNFVEGSNTPIKTTDINGNTFQERKLENGSTHIIRKNFPSEDFIRKELEGLASGTRFISLAYYWILIYTR